MGEELGSTFLRGENLYNCLEFFCMEDLSCIPSLFIHLFIYVSTNSRIGILYFWLCFEYNPIVYYIIFLLTLLWLSPLGAFQSAPVSYHTALRALSYFQVLHIHCSRLICLSPPIRPFFPSSLGSFYWRMLLETKIWALAPVSFYRYDITEIYGICSRSKGDLLQS